MINTKQAKIQFSRGRDIVENRSIAIIQLNELVSHLPGQPVLVRYYRDEADHQGEVDSILAVGIAAGIGEDKYRIVDFGGKTLIRGVSYEIPDVSKLVHSEVYLWWNDEDNVWCYVWKNEDSPERIITPIPEDAEPMIFENSEDGYIWFYKEGILKRIDDYYSVREMELLFNQVIDVINYKCSIWSLDGYLFREGTTNTICCQVSVIDPSGNNVLENCEFDPGIEPDPSGNFTVRGISKSTDISINAWYKISDNIKIRIPSNSIGIRFGYDYYYGSIKDSLNISKLSKKLWYRHSLTVEINLNNSYSVILYPKAYGLAEIFDIHGINYKEEYNISTVQVDGLDYYCYTKKVAAIIPNFQQTIKFPNEINQVDTDPVVELNEAWINRNSANGLAVLNKNGQLDKSLLSDVLDELKEVVFLKDIVLERPESGMVEGEIYYITSEDKLFTAISSSSGVLSDPLINCIYIVDRIAYRYLDNSMKSMKTVARSEEIEDLTEILD